MALVTYILEKNGENIGNLNAITGPDLPSTHDAALDDLRQALRNQELGNVVFFIPPSPQSAGNLGVTDDAVKWTATLTHLARTMDLYLALENAYQHYGDPFGPLLDQSEKSILLSNFASSMDGLDNLGNNDVVFGGSGVSEDEVQAGNWPMKVHVAVGYAALMQQDISSSFPYQHWVQRALRSAGGPTDQNRSYHWHYQTSNVNDGGARRFWAEGPFYLHFSLREIIPFWHGMRINDMLGYHPDFNVSDPFNNSWFTTPMHWLADLSTPEGRTPPLDDGNKRSLVNSSVLRWSSAYGDGALGQKFAWINDQAGNFASSRHLLTVELAIPRDGGDGTAPVSSVGNTSASETGVDGEQQIVLRRNAGGNACDQPGGSGDCHYILMNGESGDAYGRGEGHEQADQLQLLYYIDGTSFLMDSGYDNASGTSNSTWNHYDDHNVLHGIGGSGGLPNLVRSIPKKRMVMEVNNPGYLYRTQHGNVDVLRGKQNLPEAIVLQDGTQAAANYKRDVLFVNGSDPYLIDFSRVKHWASWTNFVNLERQFTLSYHVNSTSVDLNNFAPDNGQFITWSGVGDSGENAYVYPLGIEYQAKVRQSNSDVVDKTDTAEEEDGPTVNLKRVDIKNFDINTHPQHFSVATIIQARGQTPSNAPKMLWGGFSQHHQGWVWKQGPETYDVFIGRESKTSASSAVRVNLQNADSQYPDYRIELPSGKRYGFARVHKSGGEWSINTNYQVNLERAPMQATLSGPTSLNRAETGTWTALVSGGSGSASYDWEYQPTSSTTWQDKPSCTGSSCSHTFYNGSDQVQTGSMQVTVTKGSETDTGQMIVAVSPHCEDNVLICPASADGLGPANTTGIDYLALRSLQTEGSAQAAALTWTTSGPVPPSRFVVQHRPDSTARWAALGTVKAADSVQTDSTTKPAYQFETGWLETGSHQFRLAYERSGAPTRHSEVVTATVGAVASQAGAAASAVGARLSRAVRALRARPTGKAIALTWRTARSFSGSHFRVQHRPDSTAAWLTLETVEAADGKPNGSEASLAYRCQANELGVGTHRFRLAYAPSGQAKGSTWTSEAVTATLELKSAYELSVYPSPVWERATVELAVRERQTVQVRLYDLLGRRVATLHDGPLPAAELRRFRLDVSADGLPSGTYFLRARGEDFATTEQITVVR